MLLIHEKIILLKALLNIEQSNLLNSKHFFSISLIAIAPEVVLCLYVLTVDQEITSNNDNLNSQTKGLVLELGRNGMMLLLAD